MKVMNPIEVCRACLRTNETLTSVIESIVPKFNSPPNPVVDLWKIFTNILVTHKDSFLDRICIECLNEIQRTYSFILKCKKSGDILKQVRNGKIDLRPPKTVSSLHERKMPIKVRVPDISQLKTENIEWIDKNNGYDEQFEVEVNTLIKHEDDDASAGQVIKQEAELDFSTENDESDGIESEDKSYTEVFICPACRYECDMVENLEKHIIEKHMEGQLCKMCNKAFTGRSIDHCTMHLRVRKIGGVLKYKNIKHYKCIACSKIFQQKSNLKRHLMIHTGERPFKCESCPKAFRQKKTLTEHTRRHTGERPHKCEICMKSFRQMYNLSYHLKKHTETTEYGQEQTVSEFICLQQDIFDEIKSEDKSILENFNCPACRYQSRIMASLIKHIIASHMKGQMCKICNKAFTCRAIEHCNIHLQENRIEGVLKSTNLKNHRCKFCSKAFRQKSNLKRHVMIHTGERPFKCENCPKTFRQKNTLTDHLRRHTGERPYKCEFCPKNFVRKYLLLHHLALHTGERTFKCESCPKMFTNEQNYREHLQRHIEGVHNISPTLQAEKC